MKCSFLESDKKETKKYNKSIKRLQKYNIVYEAYDIHDS